MKQMMTAVGVALVTTLTLSACGDDPVEVAADPVDGRVVASDFDTLDADGDSYLDIDEIPEIADRSAFEDWDADADSEIDRDEINGNAFELWDADGNGTISATEWESSTALWFPDTARVVALNDWDADGDSELDADEFQEEFDYTALGEAWTSGPLDEEQFKDAYFGLYDSDDDGQVSEDEFRDGLAVFGASTST